MHVDIHAHFFNTRYIPVAGVGRSRGIPPALARLIATGIRIATPDDDSLEHDGSWFAREPLASEFALTPALDPHPAELTPSEAIDRFVATAPPWLVRSNEFDEVVREANDARGLFASAAVAPAGASEPQRRAWLQSYLRGDKALLVAAPASASADDAGEPGVGGYLAFLYNLTCREKTLVDHHQRHSAGVGLFVHLMMDMEWPYQDAPSYDLPRSIRRIRRLCRQSGGRVIPFVAFDAYRPDSLRLVTDALVHQSFVGVKFYAPSGYRVDSNEQAVRARDDVPPAELDRRCAALVEFCATNDIPIMSHCTPQGMEVSPKRHSGFNADPEFWRDQLATHRTLRLCFAHAGGHGHWFPGATAPGDTPPHYPWANAIIDLCTTYPNVYADLSHMGEALDDAGADALTQTLVSDFDATAEKAYPFSTKTMYGTDFPMPLPLGGWTGYYEQILGSVRRNAALAPFEDAVFRRNAVAFLNLEAFVESRGSDLTPEQVRFLATYA
jgi:predicted TIM-barrel fold metal-dependent hydrolase